jgi:hypothetical protein
MHEVLRNRLLRHIEALPEAQLYQALDYVEFLASKYARDSIRQPNSVQRFGERLEDKMRGQGLAFGTIKGALGVVGTASRMVSGITEAGKSVMKEVEQVMMPRDQPPPTALPQGDGDPQNGPPPAR